MLKEGPENKVLAYADDVNLLGDNIDTLMKNTQSLIDASKEVGLEIYIKETVCIIYIYILLSRHHNRSKSGHKHSKQNV
jgi:hypothetical protein